MHVYCNHRYLGEAKTMRSAIGLMFKNEEMLDVLDISLGDDGCRHIEPDLFGDGPMDVTYLITSEEGLELPSEPMPDTIGMALTQLGTFLRAARGDEQAMKDLGLTEA